MANIKVKLTLLTAGGSSGPLYNAYYTTDGTTYIIAVDGSNVTLASVGSEVIVTVPDNSTNIKLVNLNAGCQDNYYVVPVVTTTTTTTLIPLSGNGTYTCASPCGSNGTFTIANISGGIGPPYQTAFWSPVLGTAVWNNYPQVSAYGNLEVGCPVPLTYTFGVRTSNGFTVYLDSTLCTTTTLAPSTVTITALNNLDPNSFTVYINGTADTGWKSGSRTYASGTVIKVVYNSNACGVTKNGASYASDTNVTLSGGVAQSFSLNNYNYWVDTGAYSCQGSIQYKQQVNPCGAYQTIPSNPPSTCDCACDQTCSGTYLGSNECRGQDLVRYQYYTCNNAKVEPEIYEVVQSCSCSCNNGIGCGQEYTTAVYCGQAGRVGTNTSSLYQDVFYVCNNAYVRTETLDDCSCSCNQTCDGEYWGPYYCVPGQTGVQRRDRKYTCNNANTGQSETNTCNQSCGAFVAPIWTPVGDPTCNGCYQSQEEVQSNVCCPDPPQGTPRTVELGISSECGQCCGQPTTPTWVNSGFSCYGTCNKYNVEVQTNPCAPGYPNPPRPGSIVEYNSAYCYQPGVNCCAQGPCCGQPTSQNPGAQVGSYYYCSNGSTFADPVYINDNPCYTGPYIYSLNGNWTDYNPSNSAPNTAPIWQNTGDPFCSGCNLYQNQIDINTCSSSYGDLLVPPVDLGVSSTCGACCGQSTTPNWVDNGSTFCDGCNLQQPQIDDNPCSSTYGDPRNVDLGVSSTCGTWNLEYYCVNPGYEKWSRLRNSCTNATCCDELVEVDSTYCGYVPPPACRTYQIIGDNADESVNGVYTNCAGGSDSFSFFGGPGTVGYICAQISTVYVTSGNGYATDTGSSCT